VFNKKKVIILTNQPNQQTSKAVVLTNHKTTQEITKKDQTQVKKPPAFFRSLDYVPKRTPLILELTKHVTLKEMISSGGEGAVYKTDRINKVAKLYHDPTKRRIYEKVKFLASIDLNLDSIAKPEDLIYKKNQFQGFTMRNLSGYKTLFFITTPARNDFFQEPLTYKFLLRLAIKITDTIAKLHNLGIVIGDIKLQNIMVNSRGDICFVDIDSIQINSSLLCHTRTFEYQPPETHKDTNFINKLRYWHYDAYSTAVLVFQLLTLGTHPYQARNLGTLDECIKRQYYQYPLPQHDDNLNQNQFMIMEIHHMMKKHFSPSIRKFFYNTFRTNGYYYQQTDRKPVSYLHHLLTNEYYDRNR